MNFPQDQNGEVLQEMADSNFNFDDDHLVDFFSVFHNEKDADKVAQIFLKRLEAGEPYLKIETRPYTQGEEKSEGIELQISKVMRVSYESIVEFEKEYRKLVEANRGYLDGWGVLQDDEDDFDDEHEYEDNLDLDDEAH
ncbi:ribonuclease E inhibitor RraB [Flocculibacter collagenilyticus]|uniref:ribonuclease E inhibitor RraB n=1 Tax=Flocculibacter collagenilyticus TaxID=2744479 RepID=UPI0018F3939F|nr:ribonuclease E inhibitor RraB [Flocculibacter collagenilyticus]